MMIEKYSGDRTVLMPLFELADDSISAIQSYISKGDVLVARDGNQIIGHLQLVCTENEHVFEMKSLAVLEPRQRSGVGRALVAAAIAQCAHRSGQRLIVSTATADIGNLRFYQRQGFRMSEIVRDAFGPDQGYPYDLLIDGIPLRDRVLLDFEIAAVRE